MMAITSERLKELCLDDVEVVVDVGLGVPVTMVRTVERMRRMVLYYQIAE
jgi:hypothetical protein